MFYLLVRGCCECFVYEYTPALTVQWTRNSIMNEAKPSSLLKNFEFIVRLASACIRKQNKNFKSLTLLIYNQSSLPRWHFEIWIIHVFRALLASLRSTTRLHDDAATIYAWNKFRNLIILLKWSKARFNNHINVSTVRAKRLQLVADVAFCLDYKTTFTSQPASFISLKSR